MTVWKRKIDSEDRNLVRRLRNGDGQAVLGIYDAHKDDLVTLAAALLADRGLAEDVVHDVFVTFMAQAAQFRLTGSLKGYLCTCVANHARNLNRAGQRQIERPNGPAEDRSPEDRVGEQEHLDRIERALAALPYEQREVLVLRVMAQESYKEIAAIQQASPNTVQGRFRYAMQKLREQLQEEET